MAVYFTLCVVAPAYHHSFSLTCSGVGEADFSAMSILDGDGERLKSGGNVAARDIVQVVLWSCFTTLLDRVGTCECAIQSPLSFANPVVISFKHILLHLSVREIFRLLRFRARRRRPNSHSIRAKSGQIGQSGSR